MTSQEIKEMFSTFEDQELATLVAAHVKSLNLMEPCEKQLVDLILQVHKDGWSMNIKKIK